MKNLKSALVIGVLALMTSCDLGPGYVSYTNVQIYISSKNIPSTGIVNQAMQINAECYAPNDCWYGLKVNLLKKDDLHYHLFAIGNYTSTGNCNDIEVAADTTISFTPTAAGSYVFTTWLSPSETINDTVTVTTAP